jgi:hypothetical protein
MFVAEGCTFEYTGVWPDNCSRTLAALVNRSPLSPTEIFKTSFWILISRMGFEAFLSDDLDSSAYKRQFCTCCRKCVPFVMDQVFKKKGREVLWSTSNVRILISAAHRPPRKRCKSDSRKRKFSKPPQHSSQAHFQRPFIAHKEKETTGNTTY